MSEPTGEVREPVSVGARALRNVLSNWGALGVNILIAFFLTPYVIRTLGSEAYGPPRAPRRGLT